MEARLKWYIIFLVSKGTKQVLLEISPKAKQADLIVTPFDLQQFMPVTHVQYGTPPRLQITKLTNYTFKCDLPP